LKVFAASYVSSSKQFCIGKGVDYYVVVDVVGMIGGRMMWRRFKKERDSAEMMKKEKIY
jgi:hypothetical protein